MQGQAGHEPLPPPAAPDARAAGPARPLPGAGRPCLQRGACQARSRQEGSQAGRRAASACVRAGVRPRIVCPCVCACACACLCAPAALPAAALTLAPVRASSSFRRRRLSGQSRAGPGFINMLIVRVVGGESRVKVTRASAPRATACVRRAARGRERSRERHACDAALKKRDGGRDPGEGGRLGAGGGEASARRPSSGCAGLGAWLSGSGSGDWGRRSLGGQWGVPLSTPGRDGALTPACALRGDPRRILPTLCDALHPKLGRKRSTNLILRATPRLTPFLN